MTTWIEPQTTPLDFDTAASSLRSALRGEVGAPVSIATLALALSKTALETGRWTKIYRFNFGNVKADIATYPGMYTTFACNEVLGGKVVWFSPRGRLAGKGGAVVAEPYEDPPGHPQTRFRAYANATDGAYEYVAFQAKIKRYRVAWDCLLAGSVEGYVRALSAAGYFTAPVETYLKTVRSLHIEFVSRLNKQPYTEVDVPDRWDWQADAVRAFAAQFDDIGMIRNQALKEMSGGWESLPPADDAEESTDPQTPTARSGSAPDGTPRS